MYVDEGTLRVLELIQQLQQRLRVGVFPVSSGKSGVDGACGLVFNDKEGRRDLCDPDTGPVWYPVVGIHIPYGSGFSLRLYRWQNGSGVSYDWECQIRIPQYCETNPEETLIVIVTKDNWYVK